MKYIWLVLIIASIIGAAISIFDSYRMKKIYEELEDYMFNNDNDKEE
jgi:hypothetical protein